MGRFLSPDWAAKPIDVPYASFGDLQTLNLYAYVQNGPLNRVDADGHDSDEASTTVPVSAGGNCVSFSAPVPHCDSTAVGQASESADEIAYEARVQQAFASAGNNMASGGGGFWSHVSNLLHGHSWNYDMRESVTVRMLPNFYSASVEAGPLSQSASYVPSTNNFYYSPGLGTGSGISLTAGWATDPNGFAGGPSGSGCFFAGLGGCGGISTSGDYAVQAGVGVGGWGAAAGYGVDPIQTIVMGMAEGEPVDPLATKVGGVYMEDPQMWIPQN